MPSKLGGASYQKVRLMWREIRYWFSHYERIGTLAADLQEALSALEATFKAADGTQGKFNLSFLNCLQWLKCVGAQFVYVLPTGTRG